jgi:endonuclease III
MSSTPEMRSETGQKQETTPGGELDSAALEAALPTLTEKLATLAAELTASEREVLSSIVTSSAMHLEKLQDINAEAEYIYSKPISAAATPEVRNHLLQLPETLGFTEQQ